MARSEKLLEDILEVLKELLIIQGNTAQHIADLRLWAFKDHADDQNAETIQALENATRLYQFETMKTIIKYMEGERKEIIEERLKELEERFL